MWPVWPLLASGGEGGCWGAVLVQADLVADLAPVDVLAHVLALRLGHVLALRHRDVLALRPLRGHADLHATRNTCDN